MTTRAVVALGANLGDAADTLRRVDEEFRRDPRLRLRALSHIISTTALTTHGYDPSAPRYLNQVAVLDTNLDAPALLRLLQRTEHAHGRIRRERWGARMLDLDLIDMDGVQLRTPWLTLPHPRAFERRFVLEPWAQVEPNARLLGIPITTLLARTPKDGPHV